MVKPRNPKFTENWTIVKTQSSYKKVIVEISKNGTKSFLFSVNFKFPGPASKPPAPNDCVFAPDLNKSDRNV
jgi:hypothetical protein